MTEPAARSLGSRDVLRIPDFRRLFLAQAISDIGDGMTFLALYLLVLDLTGSTALIALVSILVALPPVTVGLVAGAYADRYDRRRMMVIADLLRAGIVLALVLFPSADTLAVVFVLALAQAVVGTFFTPARAAVVPRVVPAQGLLAANSLSQMSRVVGTVVGFGFSGAVVGAVGVVWPAFVLDAASFLVSALIVLGVSREAGRISADAAATARERGVRGSVSDGLRVIARSRPLVAVLTGVAVTMLGLGAINVLFVPFVFRDLGASPTWAGPIEGAQSLSMILSGVVIAARGGRIMVSALFVGGLVGVAACVGSLAFAASAPMVLASMFAVGWFVMPVQAATATIVQQATTDAVRGRVSAALNAAVQTATILSMAAAGILADIVGIRLVFAAGAVIVGAAAIVAWALFRGAALLDAGAPRDPERSPAPTGQPEAGPPASALPHSAAGAD